MEYLLTYYVAENNSSVVTVQVSKAIYLKNAKPCFGFLFEFYLSSAFRL